MLLEVEDPKAPDLEESLREFWVKPIAEHGIRDGVDVQFVIHVVKMVSDWKRTIPQAVEEVARGNYSGAIVEGEFLARPLQQRAPDLPIVAFLSDPVGGGFAQSLARPGGNVTGCHRGSVEVAIKQVEILRRIVPGAARIAWIGFEPMLKTVWPPFAAAAKAAGVSVRQLLIDTRESSRGFPTLERAFESLRREGITCAHYHSGADPDIKAVPPMALKHRIALSYQGPPQDLQIEGLLVMYRALRDGVQSRMAAAMAKILRGTPPGEIPFEGPTVFSLRFNMRTAERIGVKIPADLQLLANEVLR